MWTISQAFAQTLRGEHQLACKVVLLDTKFNPVEGGTIFSADQTNEISNFITDGNVDVDSERGTRRTAELTLLNPTAEFTPATENFDPEGPWVGKIYLNRIVRLYRGVYVHNQPEYVPIGTFMIDNAEVIGERNMSLVVITLSDLWKKLGKSSTSGPINYPVGKLYTDIVRDMLTATGADQPLAPVIDELGSRAADDTKLGKKLTIEEGSSRGDTLKELAKEWDIDVYFDPMGRFILQDRKAARDKSVVWHFYSSSERTGMLEGVRRSFNDDNLYNHVVVIGGGSNPIRREKIDTDPRSKTRVSLIGDRVWLIKDEKLNTASKCDKALKRAWDLRFQISETLQCTTICNPALEADDVIRVTDETWTKVNGTYRLTRFNIPLISSRQTIQAANIIWEKDL